MFGLQGIFLLALTALLWSQMTWAAGLMEAYAQAAAGDPTLRQAEANRQASQEAKPQARALSLPTISASAEDDYNFGVGGPGTSESSFNGYNVSVTLTQPVYNRGNKVQQRQADSVVNQADADYLSAQQDLMIRVSERYFDVLARQDDLTFTIADKDAIARQLEQAKRRFEVGLITITDVHEAQARFDLAAANEIVVRNNLSDSQEALREITGQFYDELNGLSDRMPLRPPEPTDPKIWETQAMEFNPQLRSATFAVETAREAVNLAQSDHYPTLDLIANRTHSDLSHTGSSRNNSIGLQLNIPIYQGGAVLSRTREASFQYEAAKEFLEGQQRSIIRQVRDAYRGLKAAISSVKALNQAQISNQSALEATEAGFEVGTRTIVDVLNAQRELFRAQRDYAQSRYSYILNGLRLKQASGQISPADLEEIEGWLEPQPSAKPGSSSSAPQ